LALAAGYAAGGDGPVSDDVITGAVAVELVHLGSLYHDDVIDEASTRRGVESVNHRWSNIVAILAGDFLLARASSLAASLGVEVAGILAATIGELCQGQVLELQRLYDVSRDEAAYFGSIEGKTASLMATACRIGAIVGGLDRRAVDALTEYGRHVGMVFQIVDDVLDLTATDEELGKPSGLDLAEGIYTLPVIYALRESTELRELLGRPLDGDAVALGRRLTCANGSITAALQVAQTHVESAVAALADAKVDATVGEALTRLCRQILDRVRPAGVAGR
jgi:heptaprenyl diphosphate synthase